MRVGEVGFSGEARGRRWLSVGSVADCGFGGFRALGLLGFIVARNRLTQLRRSSRPLAYL
ncbi:unnamed protein product [Prunus armeniaca]|uniref:Uncharacterized protein n=1 Tax=Prunus armeniaca TaxID=36596 RepID=A0A6J5WU34_PRUAR|nr:unnamed protein product [Prunus armeniaca]